jgi:hypothetical protein
MFVKWKMGRGKIKRELKHQWSSASGRDFICNPEQMFVYLQ